MKFDIPVVDRLNTQPQSAREELLKSKCMTG